MVLLTLLASVLAGTAFLNTAVTMNIAAAPPVIITTRFEARETMRPNLLNQRPKRAAVWDRIIDEGNVSLFTCNLILRQLMK